MALGRPVPGVQGARDAAHRLLQPLRPGGPERDHERREQRRDPERVRCEVVPEVREHIHRAAGAEGGDVHDQDLPAHVSAPRLHVQRPHLRRHQVLEGRPPRAQAQSRDRHDAGHAAELSLPPGRQKHEGDGGARGVPVRPWRVLHRQGRRARPLDAGAAALQPHHCRVRWPETTSGVRHVFNDRQQEPHRAVSAHLCQKVRAVHQAFGVHRASFRRDHHEGHGRAERHGSHPDGGHRTEVLRHAYTLVAGNPRQKHLFAEERHRVPGGKDEGNQQEPEDRRHQGGRDQGLGGAVLVPRPVRQEQLRAEDQVPGPHDPQAHRRDAR
mmetsp:Transcript_68047/g.208606  ORF Transcript_68047/g.208606 Transcript_68047/m.208606 type:complete len:326 (-) Transcript_68047:2477-3454(-)